MMMMAPAEFAAVSLPDTVDCAWGPRFLVFLLPLVEAGNEKISSSMILLIKKYARPLHRSSLSHSCIVLFDVRQYLTFKSYLHVPHSKLFARVELDIPCPCT
jgi:hypothetical protein